MRNLLLLSAIAVFPARVSADPCPRGYEHVVRGAWTVCQPITDPRRCEPIDGSVCYAGTDFIIDSHLAACWRWVHVHNARCAANKAVAKAQTEFDAMLCPSTAPMDDVAWCTAAARAVLRAQRNAREVRKETERRLRQPVSGGGRGVHIMF